MAQHLYGRPRELRTGAAGQAQPGEGPAGKGPEMSSMLN